MCVFCGAVNCPIASIVLSIELFGAGQLVYFALACGIAYMLSGYFGLYSSQKILYSKLRTEFINIHAKKNASAMPGHGTCPGNFDAEKNYIICV